MDFANFFSSGQDQTMDSLLNKQKILEALQNLQGGAGLTPQQSSQGGRLVTINSPLSGMGDILSKLLKNGGEKEPGIIAEKTPWDSMKSFSTNPNIWA